MGVNPWGLDATALMVWGLVAHLLVDWLLQNEHMALNKMKRRHRGFGKLADGYDLTPEQVEEQAGNAVIVKSYGGAYGTLPTRWWDRHPAAYVHAGLHWIGLGLVFGPLPGLVLAAAHFFIDLRFPVVWWSRLIGQTQPEGLRVLTDQVSVGFDVARARAGAEPGTTIIEAVANVTAPQVTKAPLYDIGTDVRIWNDQCWHIACVAVAALVLG